MTDSERASRRHRDPGINFAATLAAGWMLFLVGLATGLIYLYPWAIVAVVGYALYEDRISVGCRGLAPSWSAAAAMTAAFVVFGALVVTWPQDSMLGRWTLGGVALLGCTVVLAIDQHWPGGGVGVAR